MNLLFVCTGNTCRSPMAMAICRGLTRARGMGISCDSAGTAALPGEPVAAYALAVLAERGVDLRGHVAQPLTVDAVAMADMVFTMTDAHKEAVLRIAPDAAGKVFTLNEYVGSGDIPDPFGGSEEIYRESAETLLRAVSGLLDRMESALPKGE